MKNVCLNPDCRKEFETDRDIEIKFCCEKCMQHWYYLRRKERAKKQAEEDLKALQMVASAASGLLSKQTGDTGESS